MVIQWPKMRCFAGGPLRQGENLVSEVFREADKDVVWGAPRWLAWLYRWLPLQWWYAPQTEYDRPRQGMPYLWMAYSRHWELSYLPARRTPARRAALRASVFGRPLYLPWGNRRWCRMVLSASTRPQ